MNSELRQMLQKIDEANDRLEQEYTNELEVNYDLDRTLVSFQANKKEIGYRWCKYKEAFSAALMRYIFDRIEIDSGTILDPFAGSGTTLFAASDHGLDSVGIELLPCSAEIIKIRSALRTADPKRMSASIQRFLSKAPWRKPGKRETFRHLRITAGAFSTETECALERYLYEAKKVRNINLRPILRFAAMCILESISYTRKDGQYLRWDSRSGRRIGKKPFNKGLILPFDDAISSKLQQIASDVCRRSDEGMLFEFTDPVSKLGTIELNKGSCLDFFLTFRDSCFDAAITSPPYCNRYDYTRTYALELAMLGVDEDKLRELRQAMLSCTVENREKESLAERFQESRWKNIMATVESQDVLGLIVEYLNRCRSEKVLNNTGIPRMVQNYFKEMAIVIFECARTLKPDAPFVMVNDNVRYQGAHIPVDLILSDFAKKAGFEIEKIWALPRGKGSSSQQMGIHGRKEIRKCVYLWRLKGSPAK